MKVKNGDTGEGQTVEITVYEYFTKHCGIELTYSANMPCLNVGKPKRPNYLPLEVCIKQFCFSSLHSTHLSHLSKIPMFDFHCVLALFTCFTSEVYKSFIFESKSNPG